MQSSHADAYIEIATCGGVKTDKETSAEQSAEHQELYFSASPTVRKTSCSIQVDLQSSYDALSQQLQLEQMGYPDRPR